jgi:hypothetical protein
MKVFKELAAAGPPEKLASLVETMATGTPKRWRRDLAAESRLRDLTLPTDPPGFAFTRDATPTEPRSGIFLMLEHDHLRVTNIVPRESGELSIDQYNAILDDFASSILRPAAIGAGVKIEESSAEADLTRWVTPTAAELLRRFSGAANKATGSSHPMDFRRWAAFLIQTHRDRSELDAETLARWLVEELGWSPEVANRLVREFEFGRELLRAYDDGMS